MADEIYFLMKEAYKPLQIVVSDIYGNDNEEYSESTIHYNNVIGLPYIEYTSPHYTATRQLNVYDFMEILSSRYHWLIDKNDNTLTVEDISSNDIICTEDGVKHLHLWKAVLATAVNYVDCYGQKQVND